VWGLLPGSSFGRHVQTRPRTSTIHAHAGEAMPSEQSWREVASAKRAALAERIPAEYRVPQARLPPESQLNVTPWPKESGWLSPTELSITDSSASDILKQVASRTWTSEEVARAFCKRAAAAQHLVLYHGHGVLPYFG